MAQRNGDGELESGRGDASSREARHYREQLRLIADALPALVSSLDAKLRVEFTNAAYEQRLACTREQIAGKSLQEVLGARAFESLRPNLDRALAGEQINVEQLVPLDEGERWMRCVYLPQRDERDSVVIGLVLLLYDLTHERAAKAERDDVVRARDDFLSLAGHELRTPLTALQLQVLSISRMLAQGEFSVKAAQRAEKAARNVRRLSRLVDELLELSRISAGRLALDRTRFDLGEAVQEITALQADELARAGCALSVEIEPGIVGEWDRARIEHIVSSLLTNAASYGKGNPVHVSVKRAQSRALILVRDAGIGIAAEEHERIFQRFERLPHQQHFGGLGLGLWMSRELAQAHGGGIHVESTLGEGACFEVELPLS